MKKKIWGLEKNIFFLGVTSFFNDFSSEMVYSVFPAFFVHVLGAGAASLGLVEGVAEGVSNILKVYSGNLSDRLQKRKIFVVSGYILSTITRPFYVLTSSVFGVMGLRFADRFGKGMRDAPRDAIISLSTNEKDLGKSFGYHRAMDTLGAIFGPLTAFFILKYFPLRFDIVFMTAFFVGIVAIGTLVFVSDIKNHIKTGGDGVIKAFKKHSPVFKTFLFAIFVLSAGVMPLAILLLRTQSVGLTLASIPLFYMVYNLGFSGFSFWGGKMSDRIGAEKVLVAGYCVLVFSYLFLIFSQTITALLFGFILFGLFSALTDGVQRSLASHLTSSELRGGALGLMSAANGLGALIAGILGGVIWQNFGAEMALLAASVVVILGLIIFLSAILGHHRNNRMIY